MPNTGPMASGRLANRKRNGPSEPRSGEAAKRRRSEQRERCREAAVTENSAPIAHRPRAEHLLHQVPRTLSHAACAAAGAKPALLAGERQQSLLRASCPTPFGPAYGCSNSFQTNLSAWHCSHTTRRKPFSSTPQRRNASNSSRTYAGSERSSASRYWGRAALLLRSARTGPPAKAVTATRNHSRRSACSRLRSSR